MSTNRLFIYDKDTNSAVCVAKGYSTGWLSGIEHIDNWFNSIEEYTGNIQKTKLILVTEDDLPGGAEITWQT